MSIYDLCNVCDHERQSHNGQGIPCYVGKCPCLVGYRSRKMFRVNPRAWHAKHMRTNYEGKYSDQSPTHERLVLADWNYA